MEEKQKVWVILPDEKQTIVEGIFESFSMRPDDHVIVIIDNEKYSFPKNKVLVNII